MRKWPTLRGISAAFCTALVGIVAVTNASADADAGVKASTSASGPDSGANRVLGDAGTKSATADAGTRNASGDAGIVPAGPLDLPDDEDDPHGTGQDPRAGGDPHGGSANPHAGGGNPLSGGRMNNGMFEPAPDSADLDPGLPAGTIRIHVLDPDGKPLPNTLVTVGVINNSVAKGESRKRVECTTDADGVCLLKDQDRGQLVAYRVTVAKDGATFAVPPFQLAADKGIRCVLHVYPVVHEVAQATLVSQAVLYVEMKDDRVQVQEVLSIYNFGKTAWVPTDLVVELPPDFTALTSQQEMNDVAVDPVLKKGARIRGTFAPGRHDVEFRWQIPYSGARDVSLFAGMPPHIASGRVMAPASAQMKLVVEGFVPAIARTDNQGQRVLVTERELRREEPALTRIKVEIRDLPTAGPGRWIASLLSLLVVLGAIVFGFASDKMSKEARIAGSRQAKKAVLGELEELERSHRSGDVGPKTYDRTKRTLLERLAGILREESKVALTA